MSENPCENPGTTRLRERIAALEADRSGLMASIRHMRRGRLDGRYLTDSIRAELARSASPGVLLETIEAELRCLRRCLALASKT